VLPAHKVLPHRAEPAEQEQRGQQEIREIRVQPVLWDIEELKVSAETLQILVPPEPRVERGKPAKLEPLATREIQVELVSRVERAQLEQEAPPEIQATLEARVQPEPVQLA